MVSSLRFELISSIEHRSSHSLRSDSYQARCGDCLSYSQHTNSAKTTLDLLLCSKTAPVISVCLFDEVYIHREVSKAYGQFKNDDKHNRYWFFLLYSAFYICLLKASQDYHGQSSMPVIWWPLVIVLIPNKALIPLWYLCPELTHAPALMHKTH